MMLIDESGVGWRCGDGDGDGNDAVPFCESRLMRTQKT